MAGRLSREDMPWELQQLATEYAHEDPNDERFLMGTSAAAGAMADPESVEAQDYALRMLARQIQLGQRGQLTPGAQRQFEHTRALGEQVGRGHREGAMQQMEARGQAGTDMQALSAQMGVQQDATARATADAQMQADLAQRTREAQGVYSQLARGARDQSFGESMATSRADDMRRMFDTDYQRDVGQREADRAHEQSGSEADAYQQMYENYLRHEHAASPERAHNARRTYENQQRERQRWTSLAEDAVGLGGDVAGSALPLVEEDDEDEDA